MTCAFVHFKKIYIKNFYAKYLKYNIVLSLVRLVVVGYIVDHWYLIFYFQICIPGTDI